MSPSTLPPAASPVDPSFRSALRVLSRLVPATSLASDADPPIALVTTPTEPARTISTMLIESDGMRAHRLEDAPVVGFAAFLDGTQRSRLLYSAPDGTPIIHGTVAAVVRERREQRLFTWKHVVSSRVYAPRRRIPAMVWEGLVAGGIEVRDVAEADDDTDADHPFALRDAAIHRLQKDREVAESTLAEEWCARETRALFIDGGISGAETVAHSTCVVGVIKSHRTLYAQGSALTTIFGLRQGERSSVFRVTSPKRAPVASWYLRLRERAGTDPMWGLIRVEVAHPDRAGESRIGARADEVSRWILAESAPAAAPDARWDKMVYGVRDCEAFLQAVT